MQGKISVKELIEKVQKKEIKYVSVCFSSIYADNSKRYDANYFINHVMKGKCKITDCILMDHVVIEPGCRLDGVVVGYRGTLGEKCSLKDCDVGCSVSVERETVAKGDCFTDGMGTFSNWEIL